MDRIELLKMPIKIFDMFPQYKKYAEMTEFDQSFVCGLIEKYKPKKIVEIGVAAGGTTAVILECLSVLKSDAVLYSIDISEEYYWDRTKRTGFVAQEIKEITNFQTKHIVMNGKALPEVIDEIGRDIDLIILDTTHILPGELLDFPVCLPYLSPNAIVVLHDIILSSIGDDVIGQTEEFVATNVLLNAVAADKIVMEDTTRAGGYPNIAAFAITEDTTKYIENCFRAMTLPWRYWPDYKQLESYRNCYRENYPQNIAEIFDKAIMLQANRACLEFKGISLDILVEKWRRAQHFVIYGYGIWCKRFLIFARAYRLKVDAIAISDERALPVGDEQEYPIYHISDLPFEPAECVILMTVATEPRKLNHILMGKGFFDIV